MLEPKRKNGTEIAATYAFQAHSRFANKYEVKYLAMKNKTTSKAFGAHGRASTQPHNLQFQLRPFAEKHPETLAAGFDAYFKIAPSNGFNPKIFSYVPMNCNVHDPWVSYKMVMLWLMGTYNSIDCYRDLTYHDADHSWSFGLNYTRSLMENRTVPGIDLLITCDLKVCGNVEGNSCSRLIEACGYSQGAHRPEGARPTVPSLKPY